MSSGAHLTFAYDADNRLSTVTHPDTAVSSYTYDAAGNMATFTRPGSLVTTYSYDMLDRLTDVANGIGPTLHYTRLPNGQVASVSETNIKNKRSNLVHPPDEPVI